MTRLQGLFIVLFSISILSGISGQTVQQLIDFADLKFEQGQYQLAAREYQRALFFGPKEDVGLLNASSGDCYFELGEYDKAVNYYRFAATLIQGDSLKAEVMLKKASCLILQNRFQLAVFDLLNNSGDISNELKRKKKVLLGVSYFGIEDFDRSESYFLQSIPLRDTIKTEQIKELFDSRKLNRPNPKVAYWMSVVIPGSGQLYSGDIKNGLNSFVLSVGLAILTYEMALNNSIFDALVTIFPWWQRYYIGGYNSAERIAKHKRQENRDKIYKLVYSTVMD